MEVQKFGGGIITGAEAIKQLPNIFENHTKGESISVFSAFGKTTNALEKVVQTFVAGEKIESAKILKEVKNFHLAIAQELFPPGHIIFALIKDIFKEIEGTLGRTEQSKNPKFIYDQVVSYGEILASHIISQYLSTVGISNKLVHATDFMKTDSNFGEANVDKVATYKNLRAQIDQKLLASHKNILTQGFIGFSGEERTTLGREGSDYTAGIIGAGMGTDRIVLWKDVPGVMDKNPKLPGNEDAKKLDFVPRDEFKYKSGTTAKGLVHDKTLDTFEGEIHIKNFNNPNSKGTIIGRKL